MSLPLTTRFGADPLLDLEVANKRYVDANAGGDVIFIVKSADEDRPSSTDLDPDSELFFPVVAGRTYFITYWIYYHSDATPDIRHRFSAPSGASGVKNNSYLNPTAESPINVYNSIFPVPTSNSDTYTFMGHVVIIVTTDGNISFDWSQTVSSAVITGVEAGSALLASSVVST